MLNRQKLLLGVVEFLQGHGRSTKLDMIKVMFLLSKEKPPAFSMYGFFPHKWGPFSSQIYSDLTYFASKGLVEETGTEVKTTREGNDEGSLPSEYQEYLGGVLERFPSTEALIDHVYFNYPEFAVRSERRNVPIKVALDSTPGFFLIGYEGRTIDDFLKDLILNNVQMLIDVRNNPRSMKYEFNRERLKKSLGNADIEYLNIPELGIESEKRKTLETREDYETLFAAYAAGLPGKRAYLDRLVNAGNGKRAAIMCFERDYRSCHRREIGKSLQQLGQDVRIIT